MEWDHHLILSNVFHGILFHLFPPPQLGVNFADPLPPGAFNNNRDELTASARDAICGLNDSRNHRAGEDTRCVSPMPSLTNMNSHRIENHHQYIQTSAARAKEDYETARARSKGPRSQEEEYRSAQIRGASQDPQAFFAALRPASRQIEIASKNSRAAEPSLKFGIPITHNHRKRAQTDVVLGKYIKNPAFLELDVFLDEQIKMLKAWVLVHEATITELEVGIGS